MYLKCSPKLQPVYARSHRSTSEDSCSTIDSPPLPPSPSQFQWCTRTTPFQGRLSNAGSSTSNGAMEQAIDSPGRPCDWIDCPFCPVPGQNKAEVSRYQEGQASILKQDGQHDTRAGAWVPSRGLHARPLRPFRDDRTLNDLGGTFTERKATTSVSRLPRAPRAETKGGSTKQGSTAASGRRGCARIDWPSSKQRPAVSSQGRLAGQEPLSGSGQDERAEEFWEVATLLGLVRLT